LSLLVYQLLLSPNDSKSFSFPGCSLIRIVSSTTPGSGSVMHGFTHDKSVPCLLSTCMDFFSAAYSTLVYSTLAGLLENRQSSCKRSSSGIVIGAFRSILPLSILMLNKQIFQSCWLFLAEQNYDFVPLHNSKLHSRIRVHNLAMIDNTLKM